MENPILFIPQVLWLVTSHTWDHMQLIKVRATVDLMVDLEFFLNQPKPSLDSSVLKKTSTLQDGRY